MEKKTKQRLYLYGLLFVALLAQVSFMGRAAWCPDLILLVVVFTGIFWGAKEGFTLGLVAGFLRGCFSPNMFPLDIILFSAVGAASAVMAKMFYRQNPSAQMFTAAVATLAVILAHTLYQNALSGNDIELSLVIYSSRRTLISTVFVAPLLFVPLQGWLKLEE
ncbi:MAG: rod shape-determining protein MreD [Candidatus Omnitrophota bacterium]